MAKNGVWELVRVRVRVVSTHSESEEQSKTVVSGSTQEMENILGLYLLRGLLFYFMHYALFIGIQLRRAPS